MNKKLIRKFLCVLLCISIITSMTGCTAFDDAINELKGNLVGYHSNLR